MCRSLGSICSKFSIRLHLTSKDVLCLKYGDTTPRFVAILGAVVSCARDDRARLHSRTRARRCPEAGRAREARRRTKNSINFPFLFAAGK